MRPRDVACKLATPVDVRFRVVGTAIRPGYQYPLFGALKRARQIFADERVWIAGLTSMDSGGGLLLPREDSRLMVRCDMDVVRDVLSVAGEELRVGDNIIRLEAPEFALVQPSSTMHSACVVLASSEIRSFAGLLCKWLRGYGYDSRPIIGRRRRISVGCHDDEVGYPVGLSEISPITQHLLTHSGVGARRHLGCGVFMPGTLPRWTCTR
jgi:CRISPR-associated protein Cas6